jgi:hypothetical protein
MYNCIEVKSDLECTVLGIFKWSLWFAICWHRSLVKLQFSVHLCVAVIQQACKAHILAGLESLEIACRRFQVIYEQWERVFHRDIQTRENNVWKHEREHQNYVADISSVRYKLSTLAFWQEITLLFTLHCSFSPLFLPPTGNNPNLLFQFLAFLLSICTFLTKLALASLQSAWLLSVTDWCPLNCSLA